MCKWDTTAIIPEEVLVYPFNRYAPPRWINNFRGIPVDSCIKDEVEYLIKKRVITLGCCCGHFLSNHTECVIHKESIDLVKDLGYEPMPFRHHLKGFENKYMIKLKTPIKRKLYYVIRYKLLPIRNRLLTLKRKYKNGQNEIPVPKSTKK